MVLEGSVRKAGDHLRISAQLIDVASGYHTWSRMYRIEMKDLFAVQEEIADAIVTTLSELVGRPASRPTKAASALPARRWWWLIYRMLLPLHFSRRQKKWPHPWGFRFPSSVLLWGSARATS